MTSLLQIALMFVHAAKWVVLAHVIMSWLINFNVLNRNQPLVWQIWTGLERLLEPLYRPIRRFLPSMGGLDLSPIVAFLILNLIDMLVIRNLAIMTGMYKGLSLAI